MPAIIYVVHPKLPDQRGRVLGFDKVLWEDLGADEKTTAFQVLRLVEKWFGGNWPNDPAGRKKMRDRALSYYRYYETSRSRYKKPTIREYVIHSRAQTFDDIKGILPKNMVQ